mmetsp:Transcript_61220/g.149876  ORF Transcript_61220/g.149876 Transcript_61220/m.149876 type:complete len:170 (+) Transcript_61220:626-1135(+)
MERNIQNQKTHLPFLDWNQSNQNPQPIVAESKGYPSFADAASKFRLGKVSGGGAGKVIEPVFIHPTVNTAPVPDFDYKEAAKARTKPGQQQVYAYDDGLTELERKQRGSIPAFLTGGAKNRADKSLVREDIEVSEYPFGLDADRFQLLFIGIFGLFALVGCLSGSIQLD